MSLRIPGTKIIPGVFDGMCHDYNEQNDTCSAMYHMCLNCPDKRNMFSTIDYHIKLFLERNPNAQWDRVVNYVLQYVNTTQTIILNRMKQLGYS